MRRLTGLDATFLYLETPAAHMHVAGVYVYDPSTSATGLTYETLRDELQRRLHLIAPYRQRLVEVPFQLHHPLWVDDPGFDLDYHLRRTALPSPGGKEELAELAADIHSRPLDRRKPLWSMHLVEGLEGGHVGVVAKTHHAAIDGASGVDVTVNLLDLTPEPAEIDPPDEPWHPERIPTDIELVGYAAASLARQPLAAAKAVRRTVGSALTLRRRNRQPDVAPPPAPFSAPRTMLNRAITPHRALGMAEISLDDAKQVKNALGGTVNDVVLAVCAGALRSYLDDMGDLPADPLVAMCPISVRSQDERSALGNRVSSMLTSLATDVGDPVERYRLIQRSTEQAKEQAQVIGAETLTDWTEFAAPALAARAARLYSRMRLAERHRPIFNVTISNVPGPQVPLYMVGAKLVAWYPMAPIADGGGLNMTVMSYLGTIHFGLVACPETVPEVDRLADHIPDALDRLLKAAA